MNIENMVNVEIKERLDQMRKMDPTTDEYKATADATLKLIDRAAKMEELNIQLKQVDERRKDRLWDNVMKGFGIAVPPTVALVAGFALSILERTDILASTAPREFVKRALRLS